MTTSRTAFQSRSAHLAKAALFLAGVFLASLILSAQGSPRVTAVDPAMGKVSDSVTVTGENLGKTSVASVFLSDQKSDYKATIINQETTKIVIKIPQVKAGSYNISIQIGAQLYIEPVRFTVQE